MEWLCLLGLLSLAITIHLTGTQGQSCLESNSEIDFSSISTGSQYKQGILPGGHQAIVPSFRFNCRGSITEWTIAVTQKDLYDFDLQVWRPSPTGGDDDNQRYVLIGQYSFTTKKFNDNSLDLEFPTRVIQVTPPSEDQLQFEPGDVIGVHVTSFLPKGSGIVLLSSSSDQQEGSLEGEEEKEVWYARVDTPVVVDGSRDCPEVTTLVNFASAVPAISVSVNTTTSNATGLATSAQEIERCSQYIILSRQTDAVSSPSGTILISSEEGETKGLIIGIVSMATILCFILCTTVVLVELLLHHRRHKIKRKRQTNVPTSTTNTITTSDAAPGITSPSNATRCNCTASMQQNICYSAASIAQENREAGGSYPYSYPYLSSMSLADVSGIRTISEGQPNPEGMIRSTAADNRDGGNITTKQRSCDNEEDIYSYII